MENSLSCDGVKQSERETSCCSCSAGCRAEQWYGKQPASPLSHVNDNYFPRG